MVKKMLVACLVALVVTVLLLAPAAAQNPPAAGGKEAPSTAQKSPNFIEGTVSGVDWATNRVTIGGVAGFLGTELRVAPETKISAKGGKTLSIKDIRKGDVIRANYRRVADQNVASSITVLYGQAAPSEKGGGGAAGK
jgi:Cu/Ag efflux protein CusF